MTLPTPSGAAPPPLRVLHLISSLHVGGAARVMLSNATLLSRLGVENHVCYLTTRNDLEGRFAEAGFPPICLGHDTGWNVVRTIRRLMRLAKDLDVDVIHTNLQLDGVYGRLAAWLSGVPVVATLHDADKPPAVDRAGPVPVVNRKTWVENLLARLLTQRFVAVSGAVRDHYVRHHWVPRERVEVVYPPLDQSAVLSEVDPRRVQELRAQLSLEDAYPVVLNVARLHPIKDHALLVESMPHLLERWPKARLLVAGDGEMRGELEALIASKRLEGSVTLLGQRSDVPVLLGACDVFVLSSRSEGLPGSVLEAMGAGKPVVAPAVGGIPEVVEDQVTGYLVASRDPSVFADAIARVAADRERARTMGLAGRRLVATKFDPLKSVKSLQGVYLAAAKRAPSAALSPAAQAEGSVSPRSVVMRSLWLMQGPRVSRRLNNRQIRILTYHGFTKGRPGTLGAEFGTHIDAFWAQLRHLRRHYNIVPLPDVVDHLTRARPLPPSPVVITIDDAYMSAYTLAFPALREMQAPATLFPAIDFVDGKGLMWTDRVKACVAVAEPGTVFTIPTSGGDVRVELPGQDKRVVARRIVNVLLPMERAEREAVLSRLEVAVGARASLASFDGFQPMTWGAVQEMASSGLISIGSHTRSHPMVTRLTTEDLERELRESKSTLESRLKGTCDLFCYPYGGPGAFDDRAAELVRAAGYRCAVTTVPGMVSRGDDLFRLRRLGPPEDPLKFDFAMSGFGNLLSESKRMFARRIGLGRAAF